MAQLLDARGGSLLIAQPRDLRRWAAGQLAPPRRGRGGRPRLDLRPLAATMRHAGTRGGFEQRLVYERLMARHVAPSVRRDLRPPAYLRLDTGERFPRLTVSARPDAAAYGPFRDRRAAAAAREALERGHALRPCDYSFEPDPALALGLGCVYAQLRTCSAPCLARVGEEAYRALAREAAERLADPRRPDREGLAWLPDWVAPASGRGLVAERVRDGVQLFPIRAGAVLEEEARLAPETELEAALASLRFEPVPGRDDAAWLVAWLRSAGRRGAYLPLDEGTSGSGSALANAVRSAVARAARGSPAAS